MPANTYSDGFPLTPLEAIEFSYFLSEAEKQEWREWLQTATMEQQNELVDILHSMWQDNQKQAVPAAFANTTVQTAPVQNQNFPAQQPVQNFPDTSFTNEVFQQAPVQPAPAPIPVSQPQQQPVLDTGFAVDNSFGSDQFQFVTEQTQPVAPQPVPEPVVVQTSVPTPAPVPVQPEPSEDLNFTFVEPQAESTPQFQDSFQSPDLSVPQVQQSQPELPPQPQPQQPQQQRPRQNNSQPQPVKTPQFEEDDTFESEHPLSQPILDESGEGQEVALKKMANTKYKPNPILEDKTPPLEEFVYKNGANSNSPKQTDKPENNQPKRENRDNKEPREQREPRDNTRNNNNNNEPRENRDNREPREQKNKQQPVTEEKKKAFFGSSELREASSKTLLDEVYKAYQDSRNKNAQSSKDLDDKFLGLLDKVMQVISTSGQLADYYETIIEKIIEVNDRVVDQAKEIQLLKNSTQSRGGVSLQDQVDEMRDDIERLNRDTRTMRIEQRKKYDEITSQLASSDADAFNKDGLVHRIDLLKSDIIQIQQQLNISSRPVDNSRSDQPRQQNQTQNQQQPQQRRQNPNIQLPKPQAPNFDRDTL